MSWLSFAFVSIVLLAALAWRRGERALSKEERVRMRKALEAAASPDCPVERFTLDIGSGPEEFAIGVADGEPFRVSREIKKPRFRGRRRWCYLLGDMRERDTWAFVRPRGDFARKVDAIIDRPAVGAPEAPPVAQETAVPEKGEGS